MTPAVCYGEPQPKLAIVSRKNKASELMVIENECGVHYDDSNDDSDDENDDANENKNLVSLIDFLDMPLKGNVTFVERPRPTLVSQLSLRNFCGGALC